MKYVICKLKQIFILLEFWENGYAQAAIKISEGLYPNAKEWQIDTILQEDELCYLYQKNGIYQNR